MTGITIEGKQYTLRFDLTAMEAIEDELGGMDEMYAAMRGGKRVKALRTVFAAMANSGAAYEGVPGNVTGQEIMRLTVAEMNGLMALIETEIRKSGRTKIKEEDDAPDGAILDASEEDEKEKNGATGDR